MKKRRSENAQLSKEEYDAANNASAAAAGVWQKASTETTRNRRILRVTGPPETTTATATTTTGDGDRNAFANVQLLGTAGTTKAAAAAPGFGGFGGMSSNNNKAPAPAFGGFSFGVKSKGAAPAPTTTTTTTNNATTAATIPNAPATPAPAVAVKSSKDNNNKGEIKFWKDQHKDLMTTVYDATPRPSDELDWSFMLQPALVISAGMETKIKVKMNAFTAADDDDDDADPTAATAPVTNAPAPVATMSTSSSAPVAATKSPASNTSKTTPAFSFGTFGTTTASASNNSFGATTVSPSMGGEAATATTATVNAVSDSSQPSSPTAPDGFREVSDPDWNNVATYDSVQIFCFDNKGKNWKLLTRKANLRIQSSKADTDKHRMVAREELRGVVHLNMLVSSVPSAKYQEVTRKKKDNTTIVSGNIIFKGLDQEKGATQFLIKGMVDTGKSLHAKMLELGVSPGE